MYVTKLITKNIQSNLTAKGIMVIENNKKNNIKPIIIGKNKSARIKPNILY